jgi:hypothetical protein
MAKKYEYRYFTSSDIADAPMSVKFLNKLGQDGWQFVHGYFGFGRFESGFFMREIPKRKPKPKKAPIRNKLKKAFGVFKAMKG